MYICALVSLVLLCSASWFIISLENKAVTNYSAADDAYRDMSPDTSGAFNASSITYSGARYSDKAIINDLKSDVKTEIFGNADVDVTINWKLGYYVDGTRIDPINSFESIGVVAGKHYCEIIDNTTGQVIEPKHEVVINKDTLSVTATLESTGPFFVGDKLTYSATWKPKNTLNTSTYQLLDGKTYTIKESDFNVTTQICETSTPAVALKTLVDAETQKYGFYNNYDVENAPGASVPYTILSTCYSTSSGTVEYYGSLNQGLDATNGANAATTLVAMQSFTSPLDSKVTYTSGSSYKHVIDKKCVVGANVTLIIPYDADMKYYDFATNTYTPEFMNESGKNLKTSAYDKKSTLCQNAIEIKSATLINHGNIIIPGVINAGNGGESLASVTAGNHSRIDLYAGGKICNASDSSNITCYGYIDEVESGTEVLMEKGNLNVIFSITEQRGGTAFSSMAGGSIAVGLGNGAIKDCAPFNRFYVESVTSNVVITQGATVNGFFVLYILDEYVGGSDYMIQLFGSGYSGFIGLNSNNREMPSIAEFRYDPDEDKNILVTRGDAKINKIDATVSMYGKTVQLSTSAVYAPLSHYWNITLERFSDGKTDCVVNAQGQDVKILPGCKFTVGEGVTLQARKLAVYNVKTITLSVAGYDYFAKAYEDIEGYKDANEKEFDATKAKTYKNGELIVDGTLEIVDGGALGGKVIAGKQGAKLIMAQSAGVKVTVKELETTDKISSASYYSADIKATEDIAEGDSVYTRQIIAGTTYYSTGSAWAYDKTITLSYDMNDDDITPVTQIAPKTVTIRSNVGLQITQGSEYLPTPTRNYYTFGGWYTDADCTTSAVGKTIYENTTLYAKWNVIRYTVDFAYGAYSEGFTPPAAPGQINFTVEELQNGIVTIFKPVGDQFFNGWYSDANCSPGNIIAVRGSTDTTYTVHISELAKWADDNGYIKLYGQWTNVKYHINYVIPNAPNGEAFTLSTVTISPGGRGQKISAVTDVLTRMYYIDYWTDASGNRVEVGDTYAKFIPEGAADDSTYTLTAHWKQKEYTVNISGNSGANKNPIIISGKLYFTEVQLNNVILISDIAELKDYEALADDYNNDPSVNKYYNGGWKLNGELIDKIVKGDFVSGVLTIEPDWKTKTKLTYSGFLGDTADNSIYDKTKNSEKGLLTYGDAWYVPGSKITLPNITAYDNTTNDSYKVYYFIEWLLNGNKLSADMADTQYTIGTDNVEILITWAQKTKVTVTTKTANSIKLSSYSLTCSDGSTVELDSNKNFWIKVDETVTISATAQGAVIYKPKIKITVSHGTSGEGTGTSTLGSVTVTATYKATGTSGSINIATSKG